MKKPLKKSRNNPEGNEIRLIVRADDMGSSRAANLAIRQAFTKGILTCAAVIAPAPWAEDAAALAKARPSWCIGVHLAVLAEWRGYRWRPVLPWNQVRSLTDQDGFLHQTPKAFYSGQPDWNEVEKELNAQVDLVTETWGVKIGYIDTHYLGGENDPEFTKVVLKIARERGMPVSGQENEKPLPGDGIYMVPPLKKEKSLLRQIGDMKEPGTYLSVFHPLLPGPEADALIHSEPSHVMKEGVGNHRVAEFHCLLSPAVRKLIDRKAIRLVDYRNFR